jgi:hypothetical protein
MGGCRLVVMITGRKLVGSYLLPYCRVSAASWQRTGFEAAMLTEATEPGAQKYILSGPKSLVSASTYLLSPDPSIYLCVIERYFVNFLRTFCVIVLIEHKKWKIENGLFERSQMNKKRSKIPSNVSLLLNLDLKKASQLIRPDNQNLKTESISFLLRV